MPTSPMVFQCAALDPYGEASVVVNGATGTGTTASLQFAVQIAAEGVGTIVTFDAALTGTFSAFTTDLEASIDGGVTWQAEQSALDLFHSPVQVAAQPLSPGAIYRLNVKSFTGGTSATISAMAGG